MSAPNDPIKGTHTTPHLTSGTGRQARRLVIAGGILFGISLAFPVIASLVDAASFPRWVGFLDVALALVLPLILLAITIFTRGAISTRAAYASYRIYRISINLLLVLLLLFFLVGDRITWEVLLPGLAWRLWLLLYLLPAVLTAWEGSTDKTRDGR